RTKTVTISGRAEDADGEPIGGGIALLPSRRSGAVLAAAFGAHIERDGRFAFSNVGPGEYVLQVLRHRQGSWNEGESATLFLQVTDAYITDLDFRASRGSSIRGRIVVDGGGSAKPGQIEVSPVPIDADLSPTFAGPPARALVSDDMTFELAGLAGPRRLIVRPPTGLTLDAIRANGIDITDSVLPFGRAD